LLTYIRKFHNNLPLAQKLPQRPARREKISPRMVWVQNFRPVANKIILKKL
jgi:hypothetical protein